MRNEADGSVLLEVQGASEEVHRTLDEIRSALEGIIDREEATPIADTGEGFGFEIERSGGA